MVGIDSDYQSLCQDLSLPEGVRKRAWGIWQDLDKLDETQVSTRDGTLEPLYNTIVGGQANFRVSYPIGIITRVKCIVIQQNL